MAFSKGSEIVEVSRKLYIGIGNAFVIGVNPNKAETEKLFGNAPDEEPEYVGDSEVTVAGTKKTVKQARVTFVIKTDASTCDGIELVTRIPFFLNNTIRYNGTGTKVQIIDKYGRTAWATVEEAKEHKIPVYNNGNLANIDSDYRPAYVGEEDLTNFIKTYLNIPRVEKWVDGRVVGLIDNPSDAEARLDHINEYFKGNFAEIKDIASYQVNNRVKCMFGVRSTGEGAQYQTVYTKMFCRPYVTNYSKFDKDLMERKNAGSFSTTEFSIEPIHEYKIEATNFNTPENDPLNNTIPNPWDNWGN